MFFGKFYFEGIALTADRLSGCDKKKMFFVEDIIMCKSQKLVPHITKEPTG